MPQTPVVSVPGLAGEILQVQAHTHSPASLAVRLQARPLRYCTAVLNEVWRRFDQRSPDSPPVFLLAPLDQIKNHRAARLPEESPASLRGVALRRLILRAIRYDRC